MKRRVLLVDDNEEFLDSTRDALELESCEVETSTCGKKAILLVEERAFDVVLMDVKMPAMNGVECFTEIKKRAPTLETIFVTAYGMDELIEEALTEGAFAVLNKPLDMALLVRTIDKVNRRRDEGSQ
jgi:DNA-binding NtrC family response regulator